MIQRFENTCIYRHSCRLPDSVSRGVVFRLRISPRIRSQNWNGSKCSVRYLCRTHLCENPRKSASLPCPFKLKIRRTVFLQASQQCSHLSSKYFKNHIKLAHLLCISARIWMPSCQTQGTFWKLSYNNIVLNSITIQKWTFFTTIMRSDAN